MVKFQIMSDLHLEFRGMKFNKLFNVSASILMLLGDICACGNDNDFEIYKEFIKYISPKYKYIYHIPGNHEYYTCGNKNITIKDTIPAIDLKIKKFLKSYKNVYYINNNTVKLKIDDKNYVIIGSTMWSFVDIENRKKIESTMNDYVDIYVPNKSSILTDPNIKEIRKYKVDDMCNNHVRSVRYIKSELNKLNPSDICIILTHHKPYLTKNPKKDNIRFAQAYESDIIGNAIKLPDNVKIWGYGHTHIKDDTIIDSVRVVSNPKGYPSQHTQFTPNFTVDV